MFDGGKVSTRNRTDYRADCFGKTRYCSKGAAIDRIRQQEKMRRMKRRKSWRGKVVLVPYRCPHCHHWHVGSTDVG